MVCDALCYLYTEILRMKSNEKHVTVHLPRVDKHNIKSLALSSTKTHSIYPKLHLLFYTLDWYLKKDGLTFNKNM